MTIDPENMPTGLTTLDGFTLEAATGQRIRVSWTDPLMIECQITADFEGDVMGAIHSNGTRRVPTVTRGPISFGEGRRPRYEHHSPDDPAYAPMIRRAAKLIAAKGYATQARQLRDARRAALDARAVTGKANVMREALRGLGLDAETPSDGALAYAFDTIQNTSW